MNIEENYDIAVAEFKFHCNNLFEDIVNGQPSMHFHSINAENSVDALPIPIKYEKLLKDRESNIQKSLEIQAENYCKSFNGLYSDLRCKKIHLNCLNRLHAAVICYRLEGYNFKPFKIFIWYVTEFLEMEGFLQSEVEKMFPYEEDKNNE